MQRAVWIVMLGSLLQAVFFQTVLEERSLATHFVSDGLWHRCVSALGGEILPPPPQQHPEQAELSYWPLAVACGFATLLTWPLGAWWISRCRAVSYRDALTQWGTRGWFWWLIPGGWEALRLIAFFLSAGPIERFLLSTPEMWQVVTWAGWSATFVTLLAQNSPSPIKGEGYDIPPVLWFAMAAYVLCFGVMNWLLYESLMLPHGDSAMYEEHLWNLLHGKGFRSYLDNGRLFLGEHVQVIHLLLIPLYILWPSQILLELCQSLALAAGAIPVFWMAQRHTRSSRAAMWLAYAYLLYFPMQFLDVAIDFKTFRPNSFEIPLLLFALDALERNRFRTFLILLALTLLCQEDSAVVLAPLGVWIALRHPPSNDTAARLRFRRVGFFLALFSVIYVVLVIAVVLPYFRGGANVHFTNYFSRFGDTPGVIVRTLLSQPWLLFDELFAIPNVLFALAILLPAGFLPLLSPGRLLIAAPLFGVLCLNEIARNPLHHFHAPLVPIVFWAAAAGLENSSAAWTWLRDHLPRRRSKGNVCEEKKRFPVERMKLTEKSLPTSNQYPQSSEPPSFAAAWCATCALTTGLFIGLSPLGIKFWDRDAWGYWRDNYVPGKRAAMFPAAFALIPRDSRVAPTDYIHPRFTHHERSYDYSHYRPIVPDDTDYIVIDTRHRYSDIQLPIQVKEYRDHPEDWELLPDNTEGYFIVLRRVRSRELSIQNPEDR